MTIESFQYEIKPQLSEELQQLKNEILSYQPGVCIERARYLTESYKETEHLPSILRRAKAVEKILDNMTIFILPGSRFVCNHASKPHWAPLYPEFDVEWIEDEMINKDPYALYDRPASKFLVDEETLPELKEIIEFWKGRTHTDRLRAVLPENATLTHFDLKAVDIGAYFQGGDGHYSPHHKYLFDTGLENLVKICEEKVKVLDWAQPDSIKKKNFYEAVIIALNSVIRFAERYAILAKELAKNESEEKSKNNLLKIAEICERVPRYPARTFREALQFMLFIHFCVQIEDNGAGISIGRYDQILIEKYRNDIAKEELNRQEALELTENFFLQIYTIQKVRSWIDTDFFRGNPLFQNLTVGGQDPTTKSDATNELSYICLEATANARVPQPSLTARLHRKTPHDFKLKVLETIRLGMGLPSLFNDELIIPALINRGYELDDAYDYCIIGCVEPSVSGLLGGRTGGAWLNMGKILEMSLYNGYDPRTGHNLHENSNHKDLSNFENFSEVEEAFFSQIDFYVKMEAVLENTIDQCWEEEMDEPLASVFACPTTSIDRGKSLKQGGAKYDFTGQQTIGTANVANSLMAIRKLIFEDKKITGRQMLHAIKTNFQDQNTDPTGPEIQAMCFNAPKYGNDIEEVDSIARDVLSYVAKKLPEFKNTRYGRGPIGGTLHCSTSTVSSNTPFGKVCGATPDGRLANKALAEGQSPMRGTDTLGPTATLSSVSKINNILLSCGSLLNQKFLPEDLI